MTHSDTDLRFRRLRNVHLLKDTFGCEFSGFFHPPLFQSNSKLQNNLTSHLKTFFGTLHLKLALVSMSLFM